MKSTLLFSAALIICTSLVAQLPQGISHQAVIRNAQGELVTLETIGMRVSILQGSAEGTAVFVETHQPESNENGLITYVIGSGTNVSGSFAEIEWANGPYFLKTEADPSGGTDYSITGTTQLMSVPFALHAQTSQDNHWQISQNNIYRMDGNVGIGTNAPTQKLDINGQIRLRGGSPGAGKVLTSSSNGTASWQPGGLILPFTGSTTSGTYGISITHNSATGFNGGGYFKSVSSSGLGVFGEATATSGNTFGLAGLTASTVGIGVFGNATATTDINYGVYGQTNSSLGYGGYFINNSQLGIGLKGKNTKAGGIGVYGLGQRGGYFVTTSIHNSAVTGISADGPIDGTGNGVYGYSTNNYGAGVFGDSPFVGVKGKGLYAVYAIGDMYTTGNYNSKKDHPLDPANKYLFHFTSESSEPLNVYSGNIETDARGFAKVKLPEYFESISRDYRYQLTVIDDSEDFVLAKVNREIQNNIFEIRTSKPFVKVSWRVEAVRNDLLMQKQ